MLNNNEKKTILVLTSSFPRWEGDTKSCFVYELSKRLSKEFNVIILAPHDKNCKTNETFGGCKIYRFKYAPEKFEVLAYNAGILSNLKHNRLAYLLIPFFFVAQYISIKKILKEYNIDLIHAHWVIPQGMTAMIASYFSQKKYRLLITTHGGDLFSLNYKVFHFLKQKIFQQADYITVVSNAMKRHIILNYTNIHSHTSVIPMGTDLKKTFIPNKKIQRNEDQIVFVGRLVEKKGLTELLNTMKLLIEKSSKIKLIIIGSGPEKKHLIKQVNQLNISSHISFVGHLPPDKIVDYYQKASIAVFPFKVAENGDQEGFGLVVIEAMGCACPVIAGNVPAVHDSVIDKQTGLLVEPKNTQALADKIYHLLKDKKLQKELSLNAYKNVVEKYDWDRISNKYADIIKNLL